MVKPDAKHDYYADLELPVTADAEDIKKQFRQLAKQYHPDRNPGREVDVVAKFQAVQAAHEILSDAQTKTKYDQDRAKLNRVNTTFSPAETDPYNFRKPTARPAPSASHFPPPPRRTQTTKDFNTGSNARFAATNTTTQGSTAPGVNKFKAFTKATPQQWDRAKFEEAARADAARGFQSMKNPRPSPGQQMPPPPPSQPARPPRAPTAPRPNAFDSNSPNDDQPPQASGFPGMSRTANMRRSGFDPSSPSPGMDEQQAPNRASAYASYNRGERPQASNAHGYFPESLGPHSPPTANKKPALSPLRHVRSESGWDPSKAHRPDFERVSSKYANTPGERTNLNGGLGRSASVRTSPVERHWDEHDGRAHFSRPHSHHGPPPKQGSSPKLRPSGVPIIDYSSSSSESSGDGRPSFPARPKAQPRRPRVHTSNSEEHSYRPFSDDDPALTGQFPSNNYTKIIDDNNNPSQYNYPPPNDGPVRRPFSNMTSPENARPNMNGNGFHTDDGIPNQGRPPPEHVHSTHGASNLHSVSEGNKNLKFTAADWEGKFGSGDEFLRPNIDTSDRDRRSPTRNTRPRARSTGKVKLNAQGHVQENIPPVPGINGHNQPGAANGATEAQSGSDGDFAFVDAQEQPKAAAFQPARFSADEWREKFKEQKWSIPSSDLPSHEFRSQRPKPQKKQSKSAPSKQTTDPTLDEELISPPNDVIPDVVAGDAMDIDGDSMENIPSKFDAELKSPKRPVPAAPPPHDNGGLHANLEDLKQTAPFAPSATGLKDLDDLSSTLPFESRAAPSVDSALNRSVSSTARRLDLPRPPKTVIPPAEDSLTQEAWETYVRNINTYLHDWNVFNIKMLDHFRTRQDQINVGMRNNWISSVGDGPSVEVFDAAGDTNLRAGFATYMAWLEDDAKCRSWWDTANERHRECFEDLARVREIVKNAARVV